MNSPALPLAMILCVVTAIRLEAADPPHFVQYPDSLMVATGDTLRLSCVATGTPPIPYIWQKDSTFLSGQTNADLVISNAQTVDSGQYAVVAVNLSGADRSQAAEVIVYTKQPCNFPWTWEARLRTPMERGHYALLGGEALDQEDNIYVTGSETTFGGGSAFFTAKYAANGSLLWTAIFHRDEPTWQGLTAAAIAVDKEGACYITGYTCGVKPPGEGDND